MRKFALAVVAVSLSWSMAHAGAKEDSKTLYDVVARSSAAFVQLLDEAGKNPAGVPTRLSSDVGWPVAEAKTHWLEKFGTSATEYAAFMSCHEAAAEIESVSDKLRQLVTGNGTAALDADYFRKEFTRCERALGLAPTFPEVAAQLAGEGDE